MAINARASHAQHLPSSAIGRFLQTSAAYLGVSPLAANPKRCAVMNDLRWLERYSAHGGFHAGGADSLLHALRLAMGAAAWRVLCRSPKASFAPILRNAQLSIQDLIAYCQQLAARSFVQAPKPMLLAYYVRQRRLFYDRPCRIPQGHDYDLMRVANRCEKLRLQDIALVANWAHQSRTLIHSKHNWRSLILRARRDNERERAHLLAKKQLHWHFFCGATLWRGYEVEPLTSPFNLWQEGRRQGHCLYRLRYACTAYQPSRFFRVSRQGRVIATLELSWRAPQEGFKGMDRQWGRWALHDLRLSYNRLPQTSLVQCMQDFAGMYNTWAQRPSRVPAAYAVQIQESIAHIRQMAALAGIGVA